MDDIEEITVQYFERTKNYKLAELIRRYSNYVDKDTVYVDRGIGKDKNYDKDTINGLNKYIISEISKKYRVIIISEDNYFVNIYENIYALISNRDFEIYITVVTLYSLEDNYSPANENNDFWISEKELYDEYGLEDNESEQELISNAKKLFNTNRIYTTDFDELPTDKDVFELSDNLPECENRVVKISDYLACASIDGYIYLYSPKKLSISTIEKLLDR